MASTGKTKAKTSSAKTSVNSSRSTGPGKGRKNSAKELQARRDRVNKDIYALLMTACVLILLLSNFDLAGSVGEHIKWLMFGLFGLMEYIFPVLLALTLLFAAANQNIIGVIRIKAAAAYVLLILLAALIQRIENVPSIEGSSIHAIFQYSATYAAGGGFFGGVLCTLLSPLGFWGTMVVLLILAAICLVLISERSLIRGFYQMRNNGSRVMHTAREDYDSFREHSAEKQIEREEEHKLRMQQKQQRMEEKQKEKSRREQERVTRLRMENKARGVGDTLLQKSEEAVQQADVHEITEENAVKAEPMPPIQTIDAYSDDIYDPAEREQGRQIHSENVFGAGSQEMRAEQAEEPEELQNLTTEFMQNSISGKDAYQEEPEQESFLGGSETTDGPAGQEEAADVSGSTGGMQATGVPAAAGAAGAAAAGLVKKADNAEEHGKAEKQKPYVFPPISLLNKGTSKQGNGQERENRATAMRLQQTLQNFGVKVTITDISCGPAVTRYELQPEMGVKVSKIVSLSDDIKLNLAAADIRIEAPIPGKAAIGIEVPNKEAGSVSLREMLETDVFGKSPSPIAFTVGKDIAGKPVVADIAKMPHLLIAGATGSGKSVCINTMIMSILYKSKPEDVRMIMIDPKVVELSAYNGIPHLLIPVVTDPKKAAGALNWAVAEMDSRYKKFAAAGAKNLKDYNEKAAGRKGTEEEPAMEKMPQLLVIIDELADLMMVAPGEVETAICRLAQLARAAGIHLVIATQRPSVNVITGLIKANVPSRIAFSVSSGVDSRTIIDMNGAEKLLGKGDMLFFPTGYPKPKRVQGAFVSDEEVGKVVDFLKSHNKQDAAEAEEDNSMAEAITGTQAALPGEEEERDTYFAEAGRFIIGKERGSIGMLQRNFKIGFNRAGRIMDQLGEAGVVGPELGTKPRKVMMTQEEFEQYLREHP